MISSLSDFSRDGPRVTQLEVLGKTDLEVQRIG